LHFQSCNLPKRRFSIHLSGGEADSRFEKIVTTTSKNSLERTEHYCRSCGADIQFVAVRVHRFQL